MNLKDVFSQQYQQISDQDMAKILEKMDFRYFSGIQVADLKNGNAIKDKQFYIKFNVILSAYIAKYGYIVD